MSKKLKFKEQAESKAIRLDLGAGKAQKTPEGFIPVDLYACKGVTVADLRQRWPWKNNSVDEAHAHYLVEYFTPKERVHFVNELYRVLKPGAQAQIITPYWCGNRAYGDIDVQWPPISESWFTMLNKSWREAQNSVKTSQYVCNFDAGLGYGLHPAIVVKNQEYQQHAVAFYKEAAQELICTLTKV